LERKQFVRRDRSSSVAGQSQYAFLHILVRDVAYGQIPRAARVDKHVAAGAWIETLGRRDELAEMLAHHYLSAFELARSAALDLSAVDLSAVAPRARASLRDSGLHAYRLASAAGAARYFEAALELCPNDGGAERAELLFHRARANADLGTDEALHQLEEARAALVAVNNLALAAETDARLAEQWWLRGQQDRCFEHLNRGHEVVRLEPASPEKALVLGALARFRMLAGQQDFAVAEQSLAIAEEVGSPDLRANALITLGTMRADDGDITGTEMIQDGLDLALAGNYLWTAIRGYSNIAWSIQGLLGDQQGSLRYVRDAERLVAKLGTSELRKWVRGNVMNALFEIGEWDQCIGNADAFVTESTKMRPHYHDAKAHLVRAFIRMSRAEIDGALADQESGLTLARQAKDPQILSSVLAMQAYLLAATGRHEAANATLDELFAHGHAEIVMLGYTLADAVWAADALGRIDEARDWLGEAHSSIWYAVAQALVDAEYVAAAEQLDTMGAVRSAALARLRAAQQLADTGQPAAAVSEQLMPALAFFRRVGASFYIAQADGLLPASA